MAGTRPTEQDVEKIRVAYGFDRPLYEQYFRYISKALRGDFGTSFRTGRPVGPGDRHPFSQHHAAGGGGHCDLHRVWHRDRAHFRHQTELDF